MPIQEAIVNTMIPSDVAKPIPVRTVTTRSVKPRQAEIPHQENTVKSASAAESAAPEESVRLAPQLSALARKEQAFRQREQALKQREQELEARLAKGDQYDSLTTKLSSKDYSEAEKLGLDYEGYTQYLLEKQAGQDPQAEAFKALQKEIEDIKKSQEEKATSEFEETKAAYKKELANLVETDAQFLKLKKFSETDSEGKEISGVDVALQLILDSWNEDEEEVTVDQALKLTDQFITERAKKYAALIEEPKPVVEERKLPPPRTSGRTLTNDMQPPGPPREPVKSLQHLSESERYAEARRRVLARRQQQG